MGISQQIEHDVAEAMKAKDAVQLSTLRLIRAAIKNAEIEQRAKGEVDMDQLAITVVKRHMKQTQEAVEEFKKGNREDLVAAAQAEIAIMQKYLPAELSDDEVNAIISEALIAAGDAPHTGKLTGDVMKRVAGRADGTRVRNLVELRLRNM
jgi:uncharacterized protein YqeY